MRGRRWSRPRHRRGWPVAGGRPRGATGLARGSRRTCWRRVGSAVEGEVVGREVGGSESGDGGGRLGFVSWSPRGGSGLAGRHDGSILRRTQGRGFGGHGSVGRAGDWVVRVRCARAIPSAEGWISGWDGVGWEGVMLLFPESLQGQHCWRPGLCPASRGARSAAALARWSHSPISAVSLETPHVFVP